MRTTARYSTSPGLQSQASLRPLPLVPRWTAWLRRRPACCTTAASAPRPPRRTGARRGGRPRPGSHTGSCSPTPPSAARAARGAKAAPSLPAPRSPSKQRMIAVSTASWPACSANSSRCATSCWTAPPAAPAPLTTPASAAAAGRRSAATATCPATWTVASSTPAASRLTAWRSAWSAAASASPRDPRAPVCWRLRGNSRRARLPGEAREETSVGPRAGPLEDWLTSEDTRLLNLLPLNPSRCCVKFQGRPFPFSLCHSLYTM